VLGICDNAVKAVRKRNISPDHAYATSAEGLVGRLDVFDLGPERSTVDDQAHSVTIEFDHGDSRFVKSDVQGTPGTASLSPSSRESLSSFRRARLATPLQRQSMVYVGSNLKYNKLELPPAVVNSRTLLWNMLCREVRSGGTRKCFSSACDLPARL